MSFFYNDVIKPIAGKLTTDNRASFAGLYHDVDSIRFRADLGDLPEILGHSVILNKGRTLLRDKRFNSEGSLFVCVCSSGYSVYVRETELECLASALIDQGVAAFIDSTEHEPGDKSTWMAAGGRRILTNSLTSCLKTCGITSVVIEGFGIKCRDVNGKQQIHKWTTRLKDPRNFFDVGCNIISSDIALVKMRLEVPLPFDSSTTEPFPMFFEGEGYGGFTTWSRSEHLRKVKVYPLLQHIIKASVAKVDISIEKLPKTRKGLKYAFKTCDKIERALNCPKMAKLAGGYRIEFSINSSTFLDALKIAASVKVNDIGISVKYFSLDGILKEARRIKERVAHVLKGQEREKASESDKLCILMLYQAYGYSSRDITKALNNVLPKGPDRSWFGALKYLSSPELKPIRRVEPGAANDLQIEKLVMTKHCKLHDTWHLSHKGMLKGESFFKGQITDDSAFMKLKLQAVKRQGYESNWKWELDSVRLTVEERELIEDQVRVLNGPGVMDETHIAEIDRLRIENSEKQLRNETLEIRAETLERDLIQAKNRILSLETINYRDNNNNNLEFSNDQETSWDEITDRVEKIQIFEKEALVYLQSLVKDKLFFQKQAKDATKRFEAVLYESSETNYQLLSQICNLENELEYLHAVSTGSQIQIPKSFHSHDGWCRLKLENESIRRNMLLLRHCMSTVEQSNKNLIKERVELVVEIASLKSLLQTRDQSQVDFDLDLQSRRLFMKLFGGSAVENITEKDSESQSLRIRLDKCASLFWRVNQKLRTAMSQGFLNAPCGLQGHSTEANADDDDMQWHEFSSSDSADSHIRKRHRRA